MAKREASEHYISLAKEEKTPKRSREIKDRLSKINFTPLKKL